jgi:hypothetical protein
MQQTTLQESDLAFCASEWLDDQTNKQQQQKKKNRATNINKKQCTTSGEWKYRTDRLSDGEMKKND